MKAIASAILIAIITGLASTLWGFSREIAVMESQIKNIEDKIEDNKSDMKYIRDRVDNIYNLLNKEK